jgi:hypothetical protein
MSPARLTTPKARMVRQAVNAGGTRRSWLELGTISDSHHFRGARWTRPPVLDNV